MYYLTCVYYDAFPSRIQIHLFLKKIQYTVQQDTILPYNPSLQSFLLTNYNLSLQSFLLTNYNLVPVNKLHNTDLATPQCSRPKALPPLAGPEALRPQSVATPCQFLDVFEGFCTVVCGSHCWLKGKMGKCQKCQGCSKSHLSLVIW